MTPHRRFLSWLFESFCYFTCDTSVLININMIVAKVEKIGMAKKGKKQFDVIAILAGYTSNLALNICY